MSTTLSPAKCKWPKPAYHIPEWGVEPVKSDDLEASFKTLVSQVGSANSYADLSALLARQLTYDQEIRIEDVAAESLFRSLRLLDDQSFVSSVRQIKSDAPKWLPRNRFNEFISHEMEMRYLLARLGRKAND